MKPIAEALEPDARYRQIMSYGEYDELRPITFQDLYEMAAGLHLPPGAPANVERCWDRALHCLLYAWFDYELMIVGEGQAFAAVELALKDKLAHPPNEGPRGFGGRLKEAIKRGLVAPAPSTNGWPDDHTVLVDLRNEIAHGTDHVHYPTTAEQIVHMLRTIICELYGLPTPPLRRASP